MDRFILATLALLLALPLAAPPRHAEQPQHLRKAQLAISGMT